jgi:colanic acid/amylovoran biosynthesis glycosyltransferase
MTPLRVVHSTPVWLPTTMTWLHAQVENLPKSITSRVVCEHVENRDRFPVDDLRCLADASPLRRTFEKVTRKLGVRNHLPFLTEACRDASLLHSHFGHIAWRDLGAARDAGIPQVVTFYGRDVVGLPREDARWVQRYPEMFARVAAIFCEGPHMARCVVALGADPARVHVHHLGVDLSRIPFQPRVWKPGQPLRILLAGAFREKKGIPDALEAISRLRRRRPGLPLEVTLIGDHSGDAATRAEAARIHTAIARHRLPVRLLGFQPHQRLYEEAYAHHIFLSPSVEAQDGDTEGGAPVTLIELAASGMPVVSTTHCDIPNVVRHGESALLAPEHDVELLAQHLELLVDAPGRWRPLAAAARTRIEMEFDAQRQGARLAAQYQRVISAQAASPPRANA